tara:strand:- start:1289 stop:1843 length:555 start_codon:yes stop_codon:yes gene_type:complete
VGQTHQLKENKMGYDLHGVNPKEYDKKDYPMLTKWEHKSWDERREEMPEDEEDQYWSEMSKRDKSTGAYFRSNVWWWRQLWNFTCQICDDVMDTWQIDAGHGNDGIEIDEETCAEMVPLMKEAIKDGTAAKYEEDVTEYIDSVEKDKNGWPKDEEQVWANYPFSKEFFEEFTTFVERSGGFTID